MTNNNNNKKKINNNKDNGKRGNPVSYNTRLPPTRPLAQQRTYSGRDLIVSDFQGTSTFGSSQYSINPRLPDKFASASLMAERYDMYQFDELVFYYHPTTAVTTTKGVVFLAWEPNANRGPPDTLVQINAYECHVDGPVYSSSIRLSIPKNRLGGPRYTRSGPTCSDLNLYDTGKLIVASDDVTGSEGGYIEVSYKIRFFGYHLEETSSIQSRVAEVGLLNLQIFSNGVPTTLLWDSIIEDFNGDDTIALSSGKVILPKGKFLCHWHVQVENDEEEDFAASIQLMKNGTLVPYSLTLSTSSVNTRLGLEAIPCVNQVVIESDGTDEFTINVNLFGDAGVLTVESRKAVMTFLALS
jgi:hypothetical protein